MKTKLFTTLVLAAALGESIAADAGDENAASWTKTPSRYLGKSETDYIQAMKARFAIHGRDVGPFGRNQDPTEKKIGPIGPLTHLKPRGSKFKTPFADVIKSIKVDTINFREKSFYVKGQIYRVGQKFSLEVRDELLSVRVDSVSSRAIGFTNMKTGEYLDKSLNLIRGITPGTGTISVPGLTRTGGSPPVMKVIIETPQPPR